MGILVIDQPGDAEGNTPKQMKDRELETQNIADMRVLMRRAYDENQFCELDQK